MFVRCNACQYDSGDHPTPGELARKVNLDKGKMRMTYEDGIEAGWQILCPDKCGEQYITFD